MQDTIQAAAGSSAAPAIASASAANAANAPGAPSTPAGGLASDFETFLRLLTSQLRNQDPLKPLDSTEFVAQLASFSAVEQQVATNTKLDELLGALTRSGIDDAARLIDRNIDASGARITLSQAGEIPARFEIPEGATEAVLRIEDAGGRVVRELALALQDTGTVWDGKNADGVTVSPGNYTMKLAANNNGEDLVSREVTISGTVREALIGNGDISLVLDNGLTLSPGDVRAIRGATSPGAANP